MDERIHGPHNGPTPPSSINGVKVKYITGIPGYELRAITHRFAQFHPECHKPLREVIPWVLSRFPMLLEDEGEKEVVGFLIKHLGHLSAADLYVNAHSLAQQRATNKKQQQEIDNVNEYIGMQHRSPLGAILAAIIYHTPQDKLQSYIYYGRPTKESPRINGPYDLSNAGYWVNSYCLGVCALHYYDAQGRMLQ